MTNLARVLSAGVTLMLLGSVSASAEPDVFTPPDDLVEGWYARIETRFGTIVARLLAEQAPQSVAHFAGLVQGELAWTDLVTGDSKKGRYYDGSPIHGVISGRMFEAGDRPAGEVTPVYYVPPEGFGPVDFGAPGRLGMTRLSTGQISGVRFFVTAAGMPWLNRRQPCFGDVVSGLDVVRRLSSLKADPRGRPLEPEAIEAVYIFKVGEPQPLPAPAPYNPRPRKMERAISPVR